MIDKSAGSASDAVVKYYTQAKAMASLDSLAGVLVAVYLIAVVVNGNQDQLLEKLKSQGGFIKWGIAVMLLKYIAEETDSKIAESFILLALIAMAINVGGSSGVTNLADQVQQIFGA